MTTLAKTSSSLRSADRRQVTTTGTSKPRDGVYYSGSGSQFYLDTEEYKRRFGSDPKPTGMGAGYVHGMAAPKGWTNRYES